MTKWNKLLFSLLKGLVPEEPFLVTLPNGDVVESSPPQWGVDIKCGKGDCVILLKSDIDIQLFVHLWKHLNSINYFIMYFHDKFLNCVFMFNIMYAIWPCICNVIQNSM